MSFSWKSEVNCIAKLETPTLPDMRFRRVPPEHQPQPTGPSETCTMSRMAPHTTPLAPAKAQPRALMTPGTVFRFDFTQAVHDDASFGARCGVRFFLAFSGYASSARSIIDWVDSLVIPSIFFTPLDMNRLPRGRAPALLVWMSVRGPRPRLRPGGV